MENKNYSHIQNLPTTSDISNSNTTTTIPSLQTLQVVPATRSIDVYSDNNNRSNIVITQPTFNKLLSETIKQEQFENNSVQEQYSVTNRSKINNIQQPRLNTSVHLNPRETINGLSTIPMSMANIGGHLIPTLNTAHLADGAGTYFVSNLSSDLPSSYKLPPSSNSDLPSPSTSSNSSNPASSNQQVKRHGGGSDPTRKREIRLKKNREAARECRRKKKEYIKCLEERVTGLENQNKALIEELRQLKELYCRREETDINTHNKSTTGTR